MGHRARDTSAQGAHDIYEKDMFAKLCPIPLCEVERLCHIVLMQMMPAILIDLDTFGKAINSIQEVGFKKERIRPAAGCTGNDRYRPFKQVRRVSA